MSGRPQAMVVLASEQLWPSIQGLVFWHEKRGGLTHLFIYHTADEERSAGPARRLARLCRALYERKIKVHLPERPEGVQGTVDESICPQAVRRQIHAWRQRVPDHTLVINATGGLKLMFAGVLDCLDLPETQVVYRELGQQGWYRLERTHAGLHAEPLEVPPPVTDHIPVNLLVQCQWEPEGVEWTYSEAKPLPILELVKAGVATHWDWNETFARCGLHSDKQQGFLFEEFVAATLLALGIRQVGRNYVLSQASSDRLEVDVVANFGGRLLLVDCKLRQEGDPRAEPVTSQIRQAAEVRRRMGGAGAAMLLVRPGVSWNEELHRLAQIHGLAVLSREDTLDFFRRIREFCGVKTALPAELAAAQGVLDSERAAGALEAFSRTRWLPVVEPPEPLPLILGVSGAINSLMDQLGQDWVVYRVLDGLCLQGRLGSTSEKRCQAKLRSILAGCAEVENFCWSKAGNSFCVRLSVKPELEAALKDRLKAYVGRLMFS